VVTTTLDAGGHRVTLVLVAAVLVASIRLHFLDVLLNLRHPGPNVMACDARLRKGDEMGWFEHGSAVVLFAPRDFPLCEGVPGGFALGEGGGAGATVGMGEPLMRLP